VVRGAKDKGLRFGVRARVASWYCKARAGGGLSRVKTKFFAIFLALFEIFKNLNHHRFYCSGSPRRRQGHTRSGLLRRATLGPAQHDRTSRITGHNFLFSKAIKAHEDLLESLSSIVSSSSGIN
jgi:hypothetical protein